jgi:hypothetical protein
MKKSIFILTILFSILGSTELKAQPPGPGEGLEPDCANPPCVPIDGGISLLLVAGAALGGKKLYNIQKS